MFLISLPDPIPSLFNNHSQMSSLFLIYEGEEQDDKGAVHQDEPRY